MVAVAVAAEVVAPEVLVAVVVQEVDPGIVV
jgi:hypothetical protein